MSVYVDSARNAFRGMVMCHMIADTVAELHALATKIGIQRKWFQDDMCFPHYDIALSKRVEAIKAGAIVVDRRQLGLLMRKIRVTLTSK
jgi:hypothetical protein